MTGFIKDHRKELDSAVWLMAPLYHRVWQWLKYSVNHLDNEIPMKDGSRFLIKRGQRLTSIRDIAKGISWYEGKAYKEPNTKTISKILKYFIDSNMISVNHGRGNREYTLVTLINYDIYNEIVKKGKSKVTANGAGYGAGCLQTVDINKNEKNEKNEEEKTLVILKEKTYYSDLVSMPPHLYQNLIDRFGETTTKRMIEILDNYKGSHGKKYADDYRAILSWVVKRVGEEGEATGKHGRHNENDPRGDRTTEAVKQYGRIGKKAIQLPDL